MAGRPGFGTWVIGLRDFPLPIEAPGAAATIRLGDVPGGPGRPRHVSWSRPRYARRVLFCKVRWP